MTTKSKNSHQLPSGWSMSTLGEVSSKPQYGWTTKANHEKGHLKLLRTTDITSGDVNWATVPYCTDEPEDIDKYLVKSGDILISRAGSIGVSYLINHPNRAVFASYLIRFRPKEESNGKYVYYYLKSPDYWEAIGASKVGIAVPNVNATKLSQVKLPIAPFDEQARIVDEIEKQFSRLDEAVAALKRIKTNLKRYKASVLKAAVEGKLTEQWRKENLPAPNSMPGKFYTYAILCDDNSIYIGHTDDIARRWKEHREGHGAEWTKEHKPVKIAHYEECETRKEAADREKWLKTGFGRKWIKRELAAGRTRQAGDLEPASELLKRILTERKRKWEKAELVKMKAKGKEPHDDKWKKKYKTLPIPNSDEIEQLQKLPAQWAYIRLGSLINEPKYGTSKKCSHKSDGIGVLRIPNVINGVIDASDLKFAEFDEKEIQAYRIREGDILTIRSNGSVSLVGKCALVTKTDEQYLYAGYLIKMRSIGEVVLSEYLMICFASVLLRKQIESKSKSTSGVNNINSGELQSLIVPISRKEEQEKIVRIVGEKLSSIEHLELAIDSNLKRAKRLRQSILKKAFSGKLIPQNPHKESYNKKSIK